MNLAEKNIQLQEENAQMKADIRSFVSAMNSMANTLGLDFSTFQNGANIGSVLSGLMPKIMTGQISMDSFGELKALIPTLEKYKPLVEDIIEK